MRTWGRLDPVVTALLTERGHDGPPDRLMREIAHELLTEMGGEVPVDMEVAASFRGAEVEISSSVEAGSIRWAGDRYAIAVSDREPRRRRRFTIGHEIMHIPFMKATGAATRIDERTGDFDWSAQEEYLCDTGAAELLMPERDVRGVLPPRPTMADVLAVCELCDASIEASARRVVDLAGIPGAVVVLEPKLKPVEVRHVAQAAIAPSLPGLEAPEPAPKLRVRYCVSDSLGFIPKDKSVEASCPLASIAEDEQVDYVGLTGLLNRELAVSARLLPITIDGTRIERVVAIAFDAEAWRNAGTRIGGSLSG